MQSSFIVIVLFIDNVTVVYQLDDVTLACCFGWVKGKFGWLCVSAVSVFHVDCVPISVSKKIPYDKC